MEQEHDFTGTTFTDLWLAITAILPSASFGVNSEGQIVVYTNLAVGPRYGRDLSHTIVEFVAGTGE